jgi:hypothetical protein
MTTLKNKGGYDAYGMLLGWEKQEMHTECWWRNLLENDHFEDVVRNGRIILIFGK